MLKAINPKLLVKLLSAYTAHFVTRGIDVAKLDVGALDYDKVVQALMSADEISPCALFDDLHCVNEMATPEAMDAMLDAASTAGMAVDFAEDSTPADVAVQMRLQAPTLVQQLHAEHFLQQRCRTFEYFQSRMTDDASFREPNSHAIRRFEECLESFLGARCRGGPCKLFCFSRGEETWFLVRRGGLSERAGHFAEPDSPSLINRTENFDAMKYDERSGELSISADGNKRLVAHYRQLFGELLFEDEECFAEFSKYTLAPLQNEGPRALVCSDIEGIEEIALREVQMFWGGPQGSAEIHRARDVFEALAARGTSLGNGRLTRASFLLQFSDSRTPRGVMIRPPNLASYTRDSDARLVEEWLTRRGFVKRAAVAHHANTAATVALV